MLLPVAAWLVGTLWLGGEIGRITDDYSVNMRDPATGELPSPFNPWARYPFFWRPLHIAMCFGLGTIFAEQWQALGVLCAVLHGGACIAVYALLRAGTRSRGPAAVGALALLLHPMNFEVVFWFCSISAAIATAVWCGLALWCVRLVRRERPARAAELAGVAGLALAVPCFYEQPASGVLALPLILLGAWLGSPTGPRVAAAAGRAVLLCGIAGVMNIVYIVLLRLTAPADFRGGAGSFVSSDRIAERAAEVSRSIQWQLLGTRLRHTVSGAWEVGRETLSTPVGIAAIGGLGLLAVIWAWAWAVEREEPSGARGGDVSPGRGAAARLCWIVAGAVLFIGAFVPIALMARQNVEPRTLYFPLVGLCIMLAQIVDALLASLPRGGRIGVFGGAVRAVVGLAAAGAAIAGVVCMVGVQTWCTLRAERDEGIARRLAELVPDPPAGAVYVPLSLDAGVTRTGYPVFDRLRVPAFGTTWSATALMQQTMRRRDVVAASKSAWARFPFDRFTSEGFWYEARLDGRATDRPGIGEFIAWERAVPFTVDDEGRVRLVRQIEIVRSDDRVETFAVPVVRGAIRAGTARGQATVVSLTDRADPPAVFVAGWRWSRPGSGEAGETIGMLPLNSRGMKREGVWLHPTYQNSSRAAMQAEIGASMEARTLRFRVTTPPEDYARFAGAMPVVVRFEVFAGGAAGEEIAAPLGAASVELTRAMAEAETRWVPVELEVPASDEGLVLRVRVESSKARGAVHAPVWVTPGMWIDAAR